MLRILVIYYIFVANLNFNKMNKSKTIKIGDKEVSLTKDGFPNLRQLTKVQRAIINEVKEKEKQKEIEEQKKAIYKALGISI